MVMLDLDGTTVDSAPDLAYCVDTLLPMLGLPPRGEAAVRLWIGNGIERLLHRALTNEFNGIADAKLYAQALPLFMELYAANTSNLSKVYTGVYEGLNKLLELGLILTCVTNKLSKFVVALLDELALSNYFNLIIAGDTLPRKKPDPLPLIYAANYFQIPPNQCLMVGDSINDITAARAAKFAVVCVSYGYNHGLDIRESQPDAVIDSLIELSQLISIS